MTSLQTVFARPEAADDFRRYTEPALRLNKQSALRSIREALTLLVDNDADGIIEDLDPQLWLKSINDLRLALSVRLEIKGDSFEKFEDMPDEDPQKGIYAVYFWLGWLQENLLEVLTLH